MGESSVIELAPLPLVFKVRRGTPELIPPAGPTPYEFKELSELDDQEGLRFHVPIIQFYKNQCFEHPRRDPARVIKEAVGRALVPYYPFAGRVREIAGRKLVVECTGEGVKFIEADADVSLEDFGETPQPPFPCLEELLYDVPVSNAIVNTPLLLIQVTRLKCGGFILALRLNHTMADGPGIVQFMKAVAELARGAQSPSVQPVWERHIFSAREPPRVTCVHREFDDIADTKGTILPSHDMVRKFFFFGPTENAALRRFIPPHLKASTFDILTACVWRCRTIALQPDPDQWVRIMFTTNMRFQPNFNPPVPSGYYGNAFATVAVLSTAAKLSGNPLEYALQLIKNAKADVTREYMDSLADLMVIKGRPHFNITGPTLVLSDVRRAGFTHLDYGWGPPAYGGVAMGFVESIPGETSFYTSCKNGKGETGVVIPLCLPALAMKRFVKELNELLSDLPEHPIVDRWSFVSVSSSL